jgi:hypothetical protein
MPALFVSSGHFRRRPLRPTMRYPLLFGSRYRVVLRAISLLCFLTVASTNVRMCRILSQVWQCIKADAGWLDHWMAARLNDWSIIAGRNLFWGSAAGISFQYGLLQSTIPINKNSYAFSLSRQTTDRQSGTDSRHHPRLKKKKKNSHLIIIRVPTTYLYFQCCASYTFPPKYSSILFNSLNSEHYKLHLRCSISLSLT